MEYLQSKERHAKKVCGVKWYREFARVGLEPLASGYVMCFYYH